MKNKIIELQANRGLEFWKSKNEYETLRVINSEKDSHFKNFIIEEEFFEKLKGKKIVNIYIENFKEKIDKIIFEIEDDLWIRIFHEQDCCEFVRLYDINGGKLEDLIGGTIGRFDWSSSIEKEPNINDENTQDESFTWTFYRIATEKVFLTLRWLGESNGCYSEEMTVEVKNLN